MLRKTATALAAVSLGACSSISPYVSHISHPDRGWPVDDRAEWSLDMAGIEAEKDFGQWQFTSSLAYVLTDNEPQRFVSQLTIKYRIPLRRSTCSTDTECRDLFGGNGDPEPISKKR